MAGLAAGILGATWRRCLLRGVRRRFFQLSIPSAARAPDRGSESPERATSRASDIACGRSRARALLGSCGVAALRGAGAPSSRRAPHIVIWMPRLLAGFVRRRGGGAGPKALGMQRAASWHPGEPCSRGLAHRAHPTSRWPPRSPASPSGSSSRITARSLANDDLRTMVAETTEARARGAGRGYDHVDLRVGETTVREV